MAHSIPLGRRSIVGRPRTMYSSNRSRRQVVSRAPRRYLLAERGRPVYRPPRGGRQTVPVRHVRWFWIVAVVICGAAALAAENPARATTDTQPVSPTPSTSVPDQAATTTVVPTTTIAATTTTVAPT